MSAPDEPITLEAWHALGDRYLALAEAADAAWRDLEAAKCGARYVLPRSRGFWATCQKRRGHPEAHGLIEGPS